MQVDLLQLLSTHSYAIMTPAAFIFGPTTSLVAGFLLRIGTVTVVPTFIALAIGELFGDVLWYWLGRSQGKKFVERFGGYVGITGTSIDRARSIFERHHDKIILITKLTAGFGIVSVIQFTAGMSRVSFKRYMALNIFGQIVWTTVLLCIGYSIGHLYTQVSGIFGKISLLLCIGLGAILLWRFAQHAFKKRNIL